MNRLILTAVLGLLAGSVWAGSSGEGWMTDFDSALKKAKAQDKVVLVEFHGSDWCPPCKKLNSEVLKTAAFKEYAKDNLVLVDADFPRRTPLSDEQKQHNEALATKFGVQYFPTVVLVSNEGEVLDKMIGFPSGGLEGFLSFLKNKAGS